MTTRDVRLRVERCADMVSLELYEGVTTGVASARAMLRSLPNRGDYPHLLPLSARAFMREHWRANRLPSQAGNRPAWCSSRMAKNRSSDPKMARCSMTGVCFWLCSSM